MSLSDTVAKILKNNYTGKMLQISIKFYNAAFLKQNSQLNCFKNEFRFTFNKVFTFSITFNNNFSITFFNNIFNYILQ